MQETSREIDDDYRYRLLHKDENYELRTHTNKLQSENS